MIIDTIQRERVEIELAEYIAARSAIERLSVGLKNCGFFRVSTSQAKETLLNRCNELIKMILQKVAP